MYEYITKESDLPEVRNYLLEYQKQKKITRLAVDLETSPNPKYAEYFKERPFKDYFPRPIILPSGERMSEVETFQIGLDPEISDTQFIINTRQINYGVVSDKFTDIIENSVILGHNLKYDVGYLMRYFGMFPKILRDSLIIVKLLKAGDRFDAKLGNCYKKFLDFGWFKAETGMTFDEYEEFKKKMQISDWTKPLTDHQLKYAADDVKLIFPLYTALTEELDKFVGRYGRKGIYDIIKMESRLISEVALMEIRGLEVDEDVYRNKIIKTLEDKYKEAMEIVGQFFTIEKCKGRAPNKVYWKEPINVGSPKQVPEALKSIGVEVPNTQEATLKRAAYDMGPEHPYYDAMLSILTARKARYLLSTFGEKILNLRWPDGKLHPSIFQIGTKTGRLSASEPNVMQFPSRELLFGELPAGDLFRQVYIVGMGYKLVVADLSQIEPRMAAQMTKDSNLIMELRKKDADLHGLTAQLVLDLPERPIKGTYERDYVGKTINLGLSYEMGAPKLAKFAFDKTIDQPTPIHWTVKQAQEYRNRYYEKFAGLKAEMERTKRKVEAALEPFDSLVHFKNRKPLYMEFTKRGRPEGWYLTKIQEWLARNKPEQLHRDYKVKAKFENVDEYGNSILDKDGNKTYVIVESKKYNEYHKAIKNIAREAYNFKYGQGSAADLFKESTILMAKRFKAEIPDYDPFTEGILIPVHDEVVVKGREEYIEQFHTIVKESFIEAGERQIKVVPIKVGSKVGDNWAECKD